MKIDVAVLHQQTGSQRTYQMRFGPNGFPSLYHTQFCNNFPGLTLILASASATISVHNRLY